MTVNIMDLHIFDPIFCGGAYTFVNCIRLNVHKLNVPHRFISTVNTNRNIHYIHVYVENGKLSWLGHRKKRGDGSNEAGDIQL